MNKIKLLFLINIIKIENNSGTRDVIKGASATAVIFTGGYFAYKHYKNKDSNTVDINKVKKDIKEEIKKIKDSIESYHPTNRKNLKDYTNFMTEFMEAVDDNSKFNESIISNFNKFISINNSYEYSDKYNSINDIKLMNILQLLIKDLISKRIITIKDLN